MTPKEEKYKKFEKKIEKSFADYRKSTNFAPAISQIVVANKLWGMV